MKAEHTVDEMGTGQICTKTLLHEGSNMHEETLLHEDSFARRVTIARRVIIARE